jgi:aminoglycoside 3-N-acetyltransferase
MKVIPLSAFFEIDPLKENDFPFFYSVRHEKYLSQFEERKTLLISDENENTLISKIWKNKFIEILQPMYPPLNKKGQRLSASEEGNFLNDFVEFIHKNNLAQRITQPENFAIFKSAPNGSIYAPFGTYFLNLADKTEKELFDGLHVKNRNVIRNAEKNNVQLRYGVEVLNDFYTLYKETMERSNMYCQEFSYFADFYESMPDNIVCAVAYFNEMPQGGIFIPFTDFGAFYLYGASAQSKTVNGSMNYLHWSTIKLLKAKGVKRYDFVGARLSDVSGTKLEGIQQFKERFGAELEEGFLWKMNLNKFDILVFDFLIYAKHKANNLNPPIDIIESEILKFRKKNQSGSKNILSKKIKSKLSSEKEKVYKKLRILKNYVTQSQLVKDLQNAGIEKGDTLLVHSSLSKIGNVKEGSKTVISALIEQVGPEGNIIMPCYSYVNSMINTAQNPDYIFNPLTSQSIVGKITEGFRKWPQVKRSLHPTHSVCALGPKAELITEGHLGAKTNFGSNTPFHRIRELKGKIVGLGINIGPVTIYHTLEDFYPELFKGVYLPKQELLKMLVDGKEIEKHISIHNPDFHINRIDKNENIEHWLHNHFREKGILHEGVFGNGNIWWMNVQELFDELLVLRKKGISIYKVPHN